MEPTRRGEVANRKPVRRSFTLARPVTQTTHHVTAPYSAPRAPGSRGRPRPYRSWTGAAAAPRGERDGQTNRAPPSPMFAAMRRASTALLWELTSRFGSATATMAASAPHRRRQGDRRRRSLRHRCSPPGPAALPACWRWCHGAGKHPGYLIVFGTGQRIDGKETRLLQAGAVSLGRSVEIIYCPAKPSAPARQLARHAIRLRPG
jgi:hypothetical protein